MKLFYSNNTKTQRNFINYKIINQIEIVSSYIQTYAKNQKTYKTTKLRTG